MPVVTAALALAIFIADVILRSAVKELKLGGLGVPEIQAMLGCKRLSGDESCWAEFVARYGGNGLALKMTGETIREVLEGDIAAFLEFTLETQSTVYGGIRRLIATQVRERLSRLEQELLRWLAMEREPMPFAKLVSAVGPRVDRAAVIEALEALRRARWSSAASEARASGCRRECSSM